MSSLQFKRIKPHSNSKNKLNIIKNMTGMNDPAFQSNKTLKQYINEKLNSYKETKLSIITKAKSLTKINDKSNYKIYNYNNKKLSYNCNLSECSQIVNSKKKNKNSSKIISSLNSFNKKVNTQNKNMKNHSLENNIKNFINNKSLKSKKRYSDNSICLKINDNSNIIPFNSITNTHNNIKIR